MASRYDEITKARAVRLVREYGGDYETEWAAMKAISARLGMSADVTQVGTSGRDRRRARWRECRRSADGSVAQLVLSV